ncbi:menaquinone biosynthesis family protein [Helicobacter pylori]|uniref:menaquinone biosynthesis family protein n=1 Tax=Helicobacter pylori TaxID=210 RepID=UPI00287B8BB6|nr:menaquinone biosynthesis family protein [Helicobacter pylori]WNE32756.1 menaquinone biosynthesis family protein [Helicobacter pylori]WNE34184.1 menaquinone biosynthesis family protein [Helicobacter pylori]WNE35610.1 menaquinone biosynthesis family protein [Helicobacter pylori]WNE37038.1 menaquinone biosynthesis family protein [Helicobacter pylori]WNE38463.1 menaquinone biosynthesis family protein [Helicobacter pylori]
MISVAHSPDADDIFMYYAIKFGWIDCPIKNKTFHNIALDIETLNQEALKNTYDVSAISFGLYPKIANDYALLPTATSFGNGYGPKLVKKKGVKLKKDFRVALSGEHTTNALLFKIYYKHARIAYMNFLDIEKAVLEEKVHAGVLIHESILDFHNELEVEKELWDVWQELIKVDLPLPLGGMAIRRSIPLYRAILIKKALIKAVETALKHQNLLSSMLLERSLIRVNKECLQTYLSLYANETSTCLNEIQILAIDKLFELGYQHGFYANLLKTKDCLLTDEYLKYRFS